MNFTWAPLALKEDILLRGNALELALELAGMLFGREEDDFSSI